MTVLFADTETRSMVNIRAGVHRYAEGAEVILFTYAFDDGEVSCWDVASGAPMPANLRAGIDGADKIVFHNLAFDRTVLRHALGLDLPIGRCHCTMAQAYAHALPGSLDKLCQALNVASDAAKDKAGRALIKLFCVPRANRYRGTPVSHPQEWARFIDYAKQDIVALREVYGKLPSWNYSGTELELWRLDQIINDRGIAVDMDLVRAALATVDEEQRRLAARVHERTEGAVRAATQRDELLRFILVDYGVALPDLRAATVERALDDEDIPVEAKMLLQDRLSASASSTAKYRKFAECTSSDGRLRGALQYAGAGRTRRWAGRLVQLQNLFRPTLPQDEIDAGVDAMKHGVAAMLTNDVMTLASSAVRSSLIAPPGRKLCVADLANIEGRVAAFLAGEKWKLDAYAAYDLGIGPDLYKLAYARSFGVSIEEVDKAKRAVGKVMELMLQYAGGVGAFVTGATTYRVDLEELTTAAWAAIPEEVIAEATRFYAWILSMEGNTYGLSERAFIVCDSLKRLWRLAHPGIVDSWSALEDGVAQAYAAEKVTLRKGKFAFRRDGSWMRILLPSGGYLVYPGIEVGDDDGKRVITYMGVDQFTRKWKRIKTYGGKLFENATQSVARDVLASSFNRLETAGYEIVTTVHDEVLAETPDDATYSGEDMADLMSATPPWATGMPLAAEGFDCHHYRK